MLLLRIVPIGILLFILCISQEKVKAFKKEKLGIAFLLGHVLGGKKHLFLNVNAQPQVQPYHIPWPVGGGGGGGSTQQNQERVEHIYKTTHVHHFYGGKQ